MQRLVWYDVILYTFLIFRFPDGSNRTILDMIYNVLSNNETVMTQLTLRICPSAPRTCTLISTLRATLFPPFSNSPFSNVTYRSFLISPDKKGLNLVVDIITYISKRIIAHALQSPRQATTTKQFHCWAGWAFFFFYLTPLGNIICICYWIWVIWIVWHT